MGDKEYKVRHILVEKEDEAKEIIVALQKGDKFEKLAERSKDPGSKANGGDLDWNAPGNFVKPFSDAMVKLPKGKFTTQPVQTQFGWHVIEVDDIREAKVPPFDEVKPQLAAADAGAAARHLLQRAAREERHVTRRPPSRALLGTVGNGSRGRQGACPSCFAGDSRGRRPRLRCYSYAAPAARNRAARGNPGPAVARNRRVPTRTEESMAFIRHPKDFFAGLLFIAFGTLAIVIGSNYTLGTAARMGPGYFPRILGGLLVALGLVLALRALRLNGPRLPGWQWRPVLVVLLSVAAFGLIVNRRRHRAVDDPRSSSPQAPRAASSGWREALVAGCILAALAVGVFVIGLKLQLPIWPAI